MKSSRVKLIRMCVVVAGLVVAVALPVRAQTPESHQFFLGVNAGAQIHSHTSSAADSFTVTGETATVTSSANVVGGFLFDVSAGYRIVPRFGVSLGLSRFSSTSDGSVVATIPNPIFFDSFRTVDFAVDSLDRRTVAVNISAVVFMPVPDFLPDDVQITFLVGPSIFSLKQDLVTTVTIPEGTQDAIPQVGSESETAVGFHGGFDITFPVTEMAGIGGFVRYSGGKVDLASASDVKVGGFQLGAGLRLGF